MTFISMTFRLLFLYTFFIRVTGQSGILKSELDLGEDIRFLSESTRNLQAICNLDKSQLLQGSIFVDLYGNPNMLTANEKAAIGKTIVETYNALSLCGSGQFRKVEKYEIEPAVFETEGIRSFSLEYYLTGNCRGCNSSSTLLQKVELNGNKKDTCPCQGPSLQKFQVLFQEKMERLIVGRILKNIQSFEYVTEIEAAPQCPAFSTFNSSIVLVTFYGCPLHLQQEDFETLSSALMETYNRVNGLNSQRCDPFFREITSVTGNFRSALGKRSLQRSTFPLPSHDVNRSLQSCSEYFDVVFNVSARCRQCNLNSSSLFDEEEKANLISSFDDDYYTNQSSDDDLFDDDFEDDDTVDDYSDRKRRLLHRYPGTYINQDLKRKVKKESDGFKHDMSNVEQIILAPKNRALLLNRLGDCVCPIDPFFRSISDEEFFDAYDSSVSKLGNELSSLYVSDVIVSEECEV
jgi:hypothetical protein